MADHHPTPPTPPTHPTHPTHRTNGTKSTLTCLIYSSETLSAGAAKWINVVGLASAVAVLVSLSALDHGYEGALRRELDRMGLQLMFSSLGMPYDAAAHVLKGKRWKTRCRNPPWHGSQRSRLPSPLLS